MKMNPQCAEEEVDDCIVSTKGVGNCEEASCPRLDIDRVIHERPQSEKYTHEIELPVYRFRPYKANTSKARVDRFRFGDSLKIEQEYVVVAQPEPGHARGEDSHQLMTGLDGGRGVHALPGSMSQKKKHLELMGAEMKGNMIVESVMVEVSLSKEDPHHHGGLIPSVLCQSTLPEKGWDSGAVLDVRPTGDHVSGERTPVSRSNIHDRSPAMVNGKMEQFRDVRSMVEEWNGLEKDDMEWLPIEGVRRGGRRMSRRISERLQNFQGGGERGRWGRTE